MLTEIEKAVLAAIEEHFEEAWYNGTSYTVDEPDEYCVPLDEHLNSTFGLRVVRGLGASGTYIEDSYQLPTKPNRFRYGGYKT